MVRTTSQSRVLGTLLSGARLLSPCGACLARVRFGVDHQPCNQNIKPAMWFDQRLSAEMNGSRCEEPLLRLTRRNVIMAQAQRDRGTAICSRSPPAWPDCLRERLFP